MTYTTNKLKAHPYAQCAVRVFENGDMLFDSYRTVIIVYCHAERKLYCTGTYSATTRKQIGWFMREYFPAFSYHTIKHIAEHNESLNVDTGECAPLIVDEMRLISR